MKYIATILTLLLSLSASGQGIKKALKFATFYTAFSGGNSLSDREVFSVANGLQTDVIETPFDYSLTAGVRKIARFGYENRANTFYNGTEKSYGDAATIGKVSGFEFLFDLASSGQNVFPVFIAAIDRYESDLDWSESGRQDQPGIVRVDHDQGANQSRGNAPGGSPDVFQLVVLVLELAVECFGKVLTQEVARSSLECLAVLHERFYAVRLNRTRKAL